VSSHARAKKQLAVEREIERLKAKEAALTARQRELRKASKRRIARFFLGSLIAVIALGVIGAVDSSIQPKDTTHASASVSAPKAIVADAGAQVSCQHFRDVMVEASSKRFTKWRGSRQRPTLPTTGRNLLLRI
jgi:hypothetical protein